MRYELRGDCLVQVVEICATCGRAPMAPFWDMCFGCGNSGTNRLWVLASECVETGRLGPTGFRWTKFKSKETT